MQVPRFNYIITIHNKEDMIEQVIKNVLMCCCDNSHIYPVLDGCTDRTEEIIDDIINTCADVPITKVYTPDVHELKSINAGLLAADQSGYGFNIILQDDVILEDFDLEKKVTYLYEWADQKLAYVSFRLGANFTDDALNSEDSVPLTDYIENAYGHGIDGAEMLPIGSFVYRSVPIKSPVCMPFHIVRDIGILEEKLAPYAHDDTEFAIRLLKQGYRNGVFALKFSSDVKWGTTRISGDTMIGKIQKRNMNYIREWHRSDISDICSSQALDSSIRVKEITSDEELEDSIRRWEENKESIKKNSNSKFLRVKTILKKVLLRS